MAESSIIYTAPKVVVETWDVPGVVHRGKTGTYRVIGEMIPAMTQDEQAEKYGEEFASMPLIWAIASRAYDLRNENPETAEKAESLRKFLQEGMRKFPNTSTRPVYNPEGIEDEIIHNYRTSLQYSLNGNLVGSDGAIKDLSGGKKSLKLLLETDDVQRVNEVSNWINRTNAFLWRQNSKPLQKLENVARFDANSGRLDFGCSRHLSNRSPAFRVGQI